MSVLGHARNDKARQVVNLPALLIVALAHGALLNGAVSPFGGESGSATNTTPSLQVALLSGVMSPLASPASSLASETAPLQEVQPVAVSAPAAKVIPSNAGVPAYYPASALSQMPEVDGFFDVPVPPGLGLNGEIELRLWIDAAGRLDRIAVQSSQVPFSYQQAAISAFQRMRYRPGQIDGRPVAAFVDIVVEMNDSAPPADVPLP
jgi:TonB family protein